HTDFGDVAFASGDWAILSRDTLGPGDIDSRDYELWNVRTGAEIPFAASHHAVEPAGVGPDGSVLEIVYSAPAIDRDHAVPVCVNVVTPAATVVPVVYDGHCATLLGIGMNESPDGLWAIYFDSGGPKDNGLGIEGTVRIEDIRAGRWTVVPADPDRGISLEW